jgi:hypothetical protein
VWEGDHLDDPDVDGRIILKLILETWNGARTELILLRIGTGNEPSGSMKCGELI